MTRYLLTLIFLLAALAATAQPCGGKRYQQRVFSQSFKTSNVVYANAPSLPTTLYLGESVTQNVNLTLDVFEPFGDTLQKRPLVILAFGGAFLIGSKDDEDMQTIADSLARRGYVTASINYRLGMNVADAVSAERAIYRATQDFSAAVRYFKEHADQYRIDTNYVYVGGVSAGGFAAMHMALVDESDRPASSFAVGGLAPRPDLGCKDCAGNSYAHSSNVRGIINYWGAIGDVNWIKPGKAKPLVSFHGDQDLIVPYGTGFPFTALFVLPQVSGSSAIKQRYDQIGAYNDFTTFAGEGHNIWGLIVMNQFSPGPNQYFQPIYQGTANFLFEQTRPEKPVTTGVDSLCHGEVGMYVLPSVPGVAYCWQVDGGQIIYQSQNEVRVQWQRPGAGYLFTTAINHLDAVSPTDTLAVWVHAPVEAAIQAPEGSAVCAGGSLPLHADSTTANQYQWLPANSYSNANDQSTLLTPILPGLYSLEVQDSNGCIGRDDIYITVLLPPMMVPSIVQGGDTLFATGEGGVINWYDADSLPIATGAYFLPTADGTYYANETAATGCESGWVAYTYLGTAISQPKASAIAVYPNPFDDRVEVRGIGEGVFTLYDITGALVRQVSFSGDFSVGLNELPSGVYMYRISGPVLTGAGRLVKQ